MRYEPPQEPNSVSSEKAGSDNLVRREEEGDHSGRSLAKLAVLEGRLHPMTLVFAMYNSIRRLIIPAVPLIFFGNRRSLVVFIPLMVAWTVLHALVRYFSFSYRIEGGELITRQGILERRERHIPVERVQEIRIEQGVLHRLFGVVDASIETAGGKGPEAALSVLSLGEAERLREAVFERRHAASSGSESESGIASESLIVRRLRVGELMLAGLTSNHLLSALALVGTLWAFVDDILPDNFYERIALAIYGEASKLLEQGMQAAVLIAIFGVLIVFALSILLSVIGSVVRFYGFTISRNGEDLQRSYGLFTRRSSSLPRRRIQVLQIQEGFLRRLFRLASLRVDTAGDRSNDQGEDKGGRDVLLPVVSEKEVDDLLPVIFPDLDCGTLSWSRVSKLAILRNTVEAAILFVLAVGAIYWYQGNAAWFGLLAFLPLIYLINRLRYRNLGYILGERFFRTRRGRLSRSTHIVPVRNAQAIVVHQSPLDRWLGLATLTVDTAGQAYTGGGPHVSNLPLEDALSLARSLAHRAAATRYRW